MPHERMVMTHSELKRLRFEHGLRQVDVAEGTGYSVKRISLWERGVSKISEDGEKALKMYFERIDRKKKTRIVFDHPPKGEEITICRENHGFSQEGLAGMIGVSQSTLALYEKGVLNVPPDVQDTMCELFGIRIKYLHRGPVRTGSGVRFGW